MPWRVGAIYRVGECVFRKGDEPAHIYIVKNGRVEVQISDDEAGVDKMELGGGNMFWSSIRNFVCRAYFALFLDW